YHASLTSNALHTSCPSTPPAVGTVTQENRSGRCTALNTVRSSADAFCAKCLGEGVIGEPEQVSAVRRELRCLRMRLGTKEQVGELFAVIGRERGHVNQRLHTLGAREPDDRARI